MFGHFGKTKPVKVRGFNDNRKYGVAAKSLKDVIKKGCQFLKLPVRGVHVCLYSDGTKVTEGYFQTLPDQSELVLLSPHQTWSGVVSDLDRLLNADQLGEQLVEAARELLSHEQSPKRRKLLGELLKTLEDRSELESRDQDQDWFTGVDARFKTKSSYMKFNCESRIRSYVKELSEATKTIEKATVMAEFQKTTEFLSNMLKLDQYNGCYFDRTEKEACRLCTREGWFTCQGSFDEALCPSLHSINPYSSRESRIVFSTWNLDHRIEKKRSIIPTLLELHHNDKSSNINLNYFYELLFTRTNLKLVHIVCHKKGAHNLSCDAKMIYRKTDKPPGRSIQQPTRGKQQPTRGKQQPTRGKQQPTGGKQHSTSGIQQPTRGKQQPTRGKQQPTRGKQQLTGGKWEQASGKRRRLV